MRVRTSVLNLVFIMIFVRRPFYHFKAYVNVKFAIFRSFLKSYFSCWKCDRDIADYQLPIFPYYAFYAFTIRIFWEYYRRQFNKDLQRIVDFGKTIETTSTSRIGCPVLSNFCSKIKIFVEKYNFWVKKSIFCVRKWLLKIPSFVRILKYDDKKHQFLSKIPSLVEKYIFGQKFQFW